MSTPLCTLDQFQSLINTLKPLYSIEVHFKPTMIDIHMLNTSNDVWTNVQYKTTITTPCSIPIDVNALTAVKGDVVDIKFDGSVLLIKSGNLTHKAPKLADPNVIKKNKDSINVTWPYVTIPLTNADIKDILSMMDNKSKYDFILSNKVFTIKDMSNDDVQFDLPIDVEGEHLSRFHGVNLLDTLINAKHFTGCKLLLGSDSPIELVYTCEWLDLTYLLAPMNRNADA